MQRLVEHIRSLEDTDLAAVSVQDIALFQLRAQYGPENEPREADLDRVKRWIATAHREDTRGAGRRHQTLLREIIDKIAGAQVGQLHWDELAFVLGVLSLIDELHDGSLYGRVAMLLNPYVAALRSRFESLPPDPTLAALNRAIRIVTTEDIAKTRHREFKVLAGIPLLCRGPLLSLKGHVRIMGDVPENATVVVEDGHCIVDGYVTGRIAVSGLCEVARNVAGTIIARDGDVRAHVIVDNALVISKTGEVICSKAQNPQLIFAGRRISVQDSSIGGTFISRSIGVQEEAKGGCFHVAFQLTAGRYVQDPNRPMIVVFRHRISCRDYGENPGREMNKLLSRAIRLRDRYSRAKRVTQLAGSEAEQFAASALMFIVGGESTKQSIEKLIRVQRRLDIINRVLMGLHDLYAAAEEDLRGGSESASDDAEADAADPFDEELIELVGDEDGDVDEEFRQEQVTELNALNESYVTGRRNPANLTVVLGGISNRIDKWVKEMNELKQVADRLESQVRATTGIDGIVDGKSGKVARVTALRQVIEAAKKRGPSNPVYVRSQSTFVRMMLRNINKRLKSATVNRDICQETLEAFREIAEDIWNRYQVRLDVDEDVETGAVAEGSFSSGVKLYSDPSFLDDEVEAGPGQLVVTRSGGEAFKRYVCRMGTIHEETLEEERVSQAQGG